MRVIPVLYPLFPNMALVQVYENECCTDQWNTACLLVSAEVCEGTIRAYPAPRAMAIVCVCEEATGFSHAAELLWGPHVVSDLADSVRVMCCTTVVAVAPAALSRPRSCNCLQCWLASDIMASFMLADVRAPG